MPTAWVVCPYDLRVKPGISVGRTPSMYRYIPAVPQHPVDFGWDWGELETLGNHILVKVSASQEMLGIILTDSDFTELTDPIPVASQERVTNTLVALGYTRSEIEGSISDTPQLLRVLVGKMNRHKANPAKDGLTIVSTITHTSERVTELLQLIDDKVR